MSNHYELLREAAAEIRSLRRKNELLSAKLDGVEMMAMALSSDRHNGPKVPMQECVAGKIDHYLRISEDDHLRISEDDLDISG